MLLLWGLIGVCLLWFRGRRPRSAAAAPGPEVTALPGPVRSPRGRPVRAGVRVDRACLQLIEDDLITFGLALEASTDVLVDLDDWTGVRALRR